MTIIKLSIGFNPCEDWSDEDLEQYSVEASSASYANLCCDAIQVMNPDIEIEDILQSDGVQIINWYQVPDYEGICLDIQELCAKIYYEFEWLVEKV